MTVRWQIGAPLPCKPTKFEPTARNISGQTIYWLDLTNRIVQISALNSTSLPRFYGIIVDGQPNTTPVPKVINAKTPSNRHPLQLVFASVFVVAAFMLVLPLYPGWKYDLQQKLTRETVSQAVAAPVLVTTNPNDVIIPKIGVNTRILEGSSLKVLDKQVGVWHQTGYLPGGNFVLAGHRFKYLPPNTSTFYNLDKLEAGDVVLVDWQGKRYAFVVKNKSVVPASDVAVIKQDHPGLTIYTCNEKSQTHRVVVEAQLQP